MRLWVTVSGEYPVGGLGGNGAHDLEKPTGSGLWSSVE